MKRIILTVLGMTLLVGLGWCVHASRNHPVPRSEPVAEAPSEATIDESQIVERAPVQPEPAASPVAPRRIIESNAPAVVASAGSAWDASSLSRTVEVLVSPEATFEQKQGAWKQLREAGKLDQAIAELEQRAAANPRLPEYPAALGQAYLQKCGTIQDVREQGILAMQADKVFDTALTLDPTNWEARFTKAVAMSYWPPMLNKSEEVIQHFQTLIQQQEVQTPQPQFAATYAWLGDQYQKTGRAEDARAVWQRGAALFPGDEKLRTKLAAAE